ncbi:MAG TPA: hypothetical protein VEQ42_02155, partial [Pyrinomonadaceae bacterium]|nr:hypothetical protein [Pyrinomonadaceae bacterium]
MLSTLAAYAISRATGRLTFGTALAALALVCLAAPALFAPELKRLLLERRPRGRQTKRRLRVPNQSHAFLLLVLALFAPIYLRLFRTHMLAPGADGVYSAGSTWYDLGLHLAISTSFLHGHNFPPVYTPLPPEPLLYPFLPDFQTALLAALGLSLRAALVVTSVPLALALTGLFYSFARRILQDWNTPDATTSTPRAAALATIFFLLNGGLGFLYLYGDWQQSGKSLFEFWSSPTVNYANMGDRRIQWTNLIADTLLPQRASLYGLSAAFIVFTAFVIFWRGCSNEDGKTNARRDANERDATERRDATKRLSFLAFFSGERWSGWRVLLPAGVLTGLLPFFHTHTYAAVGLVSGFLFLLRPRRAWLAFWLPAVLLAAPHFANLSGHVSAHGFLRFQPGWRGHNEPNWPLYWLRNVGVPTLLIVPALIAAPRAWRVFYLAFVALLVFALVVIVSPNDYDNFKLMYYWHAA